MHTANEGFSNYRRDGHPHSLDNTLDLFQSSTNICFLPVASIYRNVDILVQGNKSKEDET
jgi:hypothetical protein